MAIFTFIGGLIAGGLGLAAGSLGFGLVSSLVGGALALGASVALNAFLAPKARTDSGAATAARSASEAQAVINQSIGDRVRIYGRCKVGGTRAFFDSRDGTLVQCIMLASHRIGGIYQYWIDDIEVALAGDGRVTTEPFARGAGDGSNSCVTIETHLGAPDQLASVILKDRFPEVWTDDHRLRGVANLVTTCGSLAPEEFQKVFPNGYSTAFRAVVDGDWCYDPRDGGQNMEDPDTWTPGTDNPALCILNYLTHQDGMRIPWARVDLPSFAAFADVCDQVVPLKGGGTERRYRLCGIYWLSEEPKDVLDRMTATCDARLYQTAAGKIAIRGGVWEAPALTLTDDHVLSLRMEQGSGLLSTYNEVRPIYTSPAHDYQEIDGAVLRDPVLQAIQGKISSDLSLIMVPSHTQAARLTKIAFARGTPSWKGEIAADLSALDALGARSVALDVSEPDIAETFEVLSFSLRPDLTGVEMSLSTLSEAAYEWDPETEEPDASAPLIDTRPPLVLPIPEDLDLTVQQRTVTGGTTGAVIVATVSAPARSDLTLEAEIRLMPAGSWEAMGVASGALEAVSGLIGDGQNYEVRARWRSQRVAGDWCAAQDIEGVANPDPPADPTGLSATIIGLDVLVAWVNPSTDGYRYTRVYRADSTDFADAVFVAQVFGVEGGGGSWVDEDPGTGTWSYWVRAFNTSGVGSDWVGPQSVTLS